MQKRSFLKLMGVGAAAVSLDTVLTLQREISLPFLDGQQTIVVMPTIFEALPEATAQMYGFHSGGGYGQFVSANQWNQYMAAQQQWMDQMAAWQQMQRYQWLQAQHIQRMREVMAQYQSYDHVGTPEVWESVQSIYGLAKTNGNPVLFGMNSERNHVGAKRTLKGASSVLDLISNSFDRETMEKTVGPQNMESPVLISLPDGSNLLGDGYETVNGHLAVSTGNVVAKNGKTGKLAKFAIGPDDNKYLVV
jgi:hypothetical protein